MKSNVKNKKGFTLVELLLVVGIIALGAVVAYVTLPKVQSTARANSEATNINTIAAGIRTLYAGTNSYKVGNSTLSETVLVNSKLMPDRMIQSDGSIRNGFGGLVTVTTTKFSDYVAENTAFTITYYGVPDAECNKLATGIGNNFGHVVINGTYVRLYPSVTPIDPAAVSVLCIMNDNNLMVFIGQ